MKPHESRPLKDPRHIKFGGKKIANYRPIETDEMKLIRLADLLREFRSKAAETKIETAWRTVEAEVERRRREQ